MRPSSTIQQDLRAEPRLSAEGEVMIVCEGRQIAAHLVDVSHSGFRASHEAQELQSGLTVTFRHPSAEGQARVMWTRITQTSIESGFFIVS